MKRIILAIGLLVVAMGLVAIYLTANNSGNDTATLLKQRSVGIHRLEEVTKSPAQILDVTGNSAHLNFVGTVPLACTVVYGTTTQFGGAAIDTNMNGGAIIEHNPVMRNLQPDTLYYYRLQGSGEDGTLYVSEIGTFRTRTKSDQPVQNLLSPERGAQVVGVSSNFGNEANNGTWGILNAFDGDPNTAWSSNSDGSKAWFEVRLAQRSRITRVEFWSRTMSKKAPTAQLPDEAAIVELAGFVAGQG
ncbi:MAG: discoidin domain-containing protein [Aggregatilineales bacterium]